MCVFSVCSIASSVVVRWFGWFSGYRLLKKPISACFFVSSFDCSRRPFILVFNISSSSVKKAGVRSCSPNSRMTVSRFSFKQKPVNWIWWGVHEKFISAPTDSKRSLISYLLFDSVPLSSIDVVRAAIFLLDFGLYRPPPKKLPPNVITSLMPVGIDNVVIPSMGLDSITCFLNCILGCLYFFWNKPARCAIVLN